MEKEMAEEPVEPQNEDYKVKPPKVLWSVVPSLVIFLLTILYINFDRVFIQCNNSSEKTSCQKIDGTLISQVEAPLTLIDAPEKVENARTALKKIPVTTNQSNPTENTNSLNTNPSIIGKIDELERDITETTSLITQKRGQIRTANEEDSKKLDEEADVLEKFLKAQESELELLTNRRDNLEKERVAKIDNLEKELVALQTHISARYSNRLMWVFLTAVFLGLCITSFIYTSYVILASLKSSDKNMKADWSQYIFPIVVLCGVTGLAITFAYNAYHGIETYMSVSLPMFKQSIKQSGDLLIEQINLFNVIGFAGTIFLIAASFAILFRVLKTAQSNEDLSDQEKAQEYEKCKKQLRAILYIGAAMLFVGIMRTGVLNELHLAFVSTAQDSAFINLLRSYITNSLSVQAGFYSIVLAIIYFPVSYWIKENAARLQITQNELDDKGLSFSFSEFIPRLLTVFSPAFAAPLASLLGYYFGT